MDRKRGSERVYVAVDSSKVVRCGWCGTAQSSHWVSAKSGQYCSPECQSADTALSYLCGFIVMQCMVIRAALPLLVPSYSGLATSFLLLALIPVSFFQIFSIHMLRLFWKGLRWRRAIPKQSRSEDVPLASAVLAARYIVAPLSHPLNQCTFAFSNSQKTKLMRTERQSICLATSIDA